MVWAVLSQWRLGKTQALFVDIRFKIYWLLYSLPGTVASGSRAHPAIRGLRSALGLLAVRLHVSRARKWRLHPQVPLPSPRG